MNPYKLLEKYGPQNEKGMHILIAHSEAVAKSALILACRTPDITIDLTFLKEAALLHDIGVAQTNAPAIGCTGEAPYMKHGLLGAALLKELGFGRHADVCERHVGVGLTKEDIVQQGLPLPHRDVLPVSLEEQLITYVDNYYSKGSLKPDVPRTLECVKKKVASYGSRNIAVFNAWVERFGVVE
ncbi:MAG: HDIG domain-containing protein [Deltaproteobacteria bacterium]|nr:HDIG domain-containing protein [Deltaproteobacteria bacterium]